MGYAFADRQFPRAPLIGAALLIAFTIAGAAAMRLNGGAKSDKPQGTVVASRDLHFDDRADGGIAVSDARDGRVITIVEPGTNGFLRASLRSLAKRRVFAGEQDRLFHLTAWTDGRLTLDDPATGGVIDLEAFGPTNEAVFARLLDFRSATK